MVGAGPAMRLTAASTRVMSGAAVSFASVVFWRYHSAWVLLLATKTSVSPSPSTSQVSASSDIVESLGRTVPVVM
jgi:hypothetical protein